MKDTALQTAAPYQPIRAAASHRVPIRGLSYHVWSWGDASLVRPDRPPVMLLHGWMDVGASFQFLVDALADARYLLAPDWRGFGRSSRTPADSYWFADYYADLDALLDQLLPGQVIDLVGHSMGGNVATLYAGVRPERIRRLVNLEGFGIPSPPSTDAPARYARWLDQLKTPPRLRPYPSLAAVAERMRSDNPRLRADQAAWLAQHWASRGDDGQFHLQSDPAHKIVNPVLHRTEESLACWRAITAPVLWVEGRQTLTPAQFGDRYPRTEIEERLRHIPQIERAWVDDCGHMLHHDQPEQLARLIEDFLDPP